MLKLILIITLLTTSFASAEEHRFLSTEVIELRMELAQERAGRIMAERALETMQRREEIRDAAHASSITSLTTLLEAERVAREKSDDDFEELSMILSLYEHLVDALEDILIRYCERSEGKYIACGEYREILKRFPPQQGVAAYEGYISRD